MRRVELALELRLPGRGHAARKELVEVERAEEAVVLDVLRAVAQAAEATRHVLDEQLEDNVLQVLVLDVRREVDLALEDVAADDHLVVVGVVRKGRVAGHLEEQ